MLNEIITGLYVVLSFYERQGVVVDIDIGPIV